MAARSYEGRKGIALRRAHSTAEGASGVGAELAGAFGDGRPERCVPRALREPCGRRRSRCTYRGWRARGTESTGPSKGRGGDLSLPAEHLEANARTLEAFGEPFAHGHGRREDAVAFGQEGSVHGEGERSLGEHLGRLTVAGIAS